MNDQSSYLNYLPPVLWSHDVDPAQFLGRMLRIFEKILTGIPDGVLLNQGNEEHQPLEKMIDHLPWTFNPWRTSVDFLPWLASWVALNLDPSWNEYQQRKLIAEIISIYQLRGLKAGLYAYLDIFTVTEARPRIAIDDGEALLRANFLADGSATLHTVAFSHAVSTAAGITPVLIHPVAVAVDSRNNYLVIDQGADDDSEDQQMLAQAQNPALWKLSSTGEIDYNVGARITVPVPQPVVAGSFLKSATAVVADIVDSQDRYIVVNYGQRSGSQADSSLLEIVWSATGAGYEAKPILDQSTTPKLPVMYPVDMVLDQRGDCVILDRGRRISGDPPTQGRTAPQLVIIRLTRPNEKPRQVNLPGIKEPTALAIDSTGCLIVADANEQSTHDPADLWRVIPPDEGTTDEWHITSLLANVPANQNPLIFPTGLAFESSTSLLVCDTGLRWGFTDDQSNRAMAEPAALYRVDLAQSPPQITRVTHERRLVHPAKMVIDRNGQVIITDRGASLRESTNKRNWRVRPHEFGIVVNFSQQRPTSFDARHKARREIINIVDAEKPGHASWWLTSK